MNEDKIQIWGKWIGHESDHPDCLLLETEIHLNDKKVDWNFVDIYSLALYYRNCKPYKDYPYSCFEPFSCSCGVAGCAGIWSGIDVKERKHSIEWRAKKEHGYGFLEKSFYSFEKKQYLKAFNDFLFWLKMECDYDYKLCVDLGYYEGDETTVDEFFEWLEGKQ